MSETGLAYLKQTLFNYRKALRTLDEILNKIEPKRTHEDFQIYQDSAIKRYEYTSKAAIKLMSRYIEYVDKKVNDPILVLKKAFEFDLIEDNIWLIMIDDRNMTTHEYSKTIAEELLEDIFNYTIKLKEFQNMITSKIDEL